MVAVATFVLSQQSIKIGGIERGGDTILGLKLGLDLEGGSDLRYRAILRDPDTGEEIPPSLDQMKALQSTIERRVDAGGLGRPVIQILGDDRLLVQLPGIRDLERAKSLIGETARLEIKHRTFGVTREIPGISDNDIKTIDLIALNEEGIKILKSDSDIGPESTSETSSTEEKTSESMVEEFTTAIAEGNAPIASETPALIVEFTDSAANEFENFILRLRDSLDPPAGTTQIYPNYLKITQQGDNSDYIVPYYPISLTTEGQTQPQTNNPSIERNQDTNTFTIKLSGFESFQEAKNTFGEIPNLKFAEFLGKLDEDIGLTGEDLERAYPGQHQGTSQPIVNLEFNSEGTRKFGEITTVIAGTPDVTAFILDDVELIAPGADRPITGGAAYIYGQDFTVERVRDIAMLLESGRLPIPIELIKERDVNAILGADSLAKSVKAGLAGLGLVLLFMALYYRVAGIVAAVALIIYAILVLAIFKMAPVTLELSGVAAAILSIGMAVDANILIFERMKEEIRTGRTLLSAINIGFNRAWPAIRDSNVSTLITCAILFWFADTLGASIVKSFAITLSIGVAISMFSAITVSRTLLRLVASTPLAKHTGMFVPSGGADLP